jgi:hypothetical protein
MKDVNNSRSVTILKKNMNQNRDFVTGAQIYLSSDVHKEIHKFSFANGITIEQTIDQILSDWALRRQKEGQSKKFKVGEVENERSDI